MDRSKLDEKGHKVVKSPTAIAGRDQLNSVQFRVPVSYFSRPFSSSFDLSNLALDRIVWNKTETDENTSCPMGDWTSQNWTKRDGRNN